MQCVSQARRVPWSGFTAHRLAARHAGGLVQRVVSAIRGASVPDKELGLIFRSRAVLPRGCGARTRQCGEGLGALDRGTRGWSLHGGAIEARNLEPGPVGRSALPGDEWRTLGGSVIAAATAYAAIASSEPVFCSGTARDCKARALFTAVRTPAAAGLNASW